MEDDDLLVLSEFIQVVSWRHQDDDDASFVATREQGNFGSS